jgi:hypothetical protein
VTDVLAVLGRVAAALEELSIPYAVSGAVAQNFWGIVRATLDLDLLMVVPAIRQPALVERLARDGARIDLVGALRSLREEHVRRFSFEGLPVEIFVPYLPFHASALRRAVNVSVAGRTYPVITAEDLVVLKALFHREKDWSDIAGIVLRQSPKFDREYVRGWLSSLVQQGDERLRRLEEILARADRPA